MASLVISSTPVRMTCSGADFAGAAGGVAGGFWARTTAPVTSATPSAQGHISRGRVFTCMLRLYRELASGLARRQVAAVVAIACIALRTAHLLGPSNESLSRPRSGQLRRPRSPHPAEPAWARVPGAGDAVSDQRLPAATRTPTRTARAPGRPRRRSPRHQGLDDRPALSALPASPRRRFARKSARGSRRSAREGAVPPPAPILPCAGVGISLSVLAGASVVGSGTESAAAN